MAPPADHETGDRERDLAAERDGAQPIARPRRRDGGERQSWIVALQLLALGGIVGREPRRVQLPEVRPFVPDAGEERERTLLRLMQQRAREPVARDRRAGHRCVLETGGRRGYDAPVQPRVANG